MINLPKLNVVSEPQAVWSLLAVLRLAAISISLVLLLLAELFSIHALQMMVNWPWIIACFIAAVLFSLFSFLWVGKPINANHVFGILLLDVALWFILLDASGGSMNPAISYLLVLLSVAAFSLSIMHSGILLIIMMVFYTLMMNYQPAVDHAHMFSWHLWGMWLLFLFNALIMVAVINVLNTKLRDKDRVIAEIKEETVRSEQMVMLGTMAANITHELGTPLSTIAMLAETRDDEDALLIQQQINRCKNALHLLKNVSFDNEHAHGEDADSLFKRLQQELLLIKPSAKLELIVHGGITLSVSGLLEQALLALINNAVEASNKTVSINVCVRNEELIVDIVHDGSQIDDSLIQQLGLQRVTSSQEGLGIGYYLANASIERLGGSLTISNMKLGVLTRVTLPKALILDDS